MSPSNIPDHTILYKCANYTRLIQIFGDDGTILLHMFMSTPPTDFHLTAGYVYFMKQKDAAEAYARFDHNRFPPNETAVLHAAVPSGMLSNVKEIFDHQWRELAWCSRNRLAGLAN